MEYEEDEQKVVERIDEELDRIYKHPLKNRRVKILYEEWAIGCISWYNKGLDEYESNLKMEQKTASTLMM